MVSPAAARSIKNDGGSSSSKFTLIVFSITLFLSASLMFAVQPMIGKMLLPLAGGTPASWVVAMAFFQLSLLFGYMLAWIMSRFETRIHTILLVCCLTAGFLFLPLTTDNHAYIIDEKGISPFSVLLLLTGAVGLPFTALSTVSSTLQRLFTATGHKDAKDPYFLYAASNIGSLLGLLSYPFLVEPLFDLTIQSTYWRFLYGGLIVLCLLCLSFAHKHVKHSKNAETQKQAEAPSTKDHVYWFLLAFIPSSLLLGTTSHITTDIVSMPLLWVLPLGIYLVTHILAFSRRQFFHEKTLYDVHPIAVSVLFFFSLSFLAQKASWMNVAVLLTCYFFIALAMHTQLAKRRPDAVFLTRFYFFLALGGAAGGSFNAFLAPFLFDTILEYPIVAILSCFLNPNFYKKGGDKSLLYAGFCLLLAGFVLKFLAQFIPALDFRLMRQMCMVLFVILVLAYHPKLTALFITLATVIMAQFPVYDLILGKTTLLTERNFFGVMRVSEKPPQVAVSDDPRNQSMMSKTWRIFTHGTTIHGFQVLDTDLKKQYVASYYGPLKMLMEMYHPSDIALVGLGAGTIRCYQSGDQSYKMYEIDPAVVRIAKENFDYLKSCQTERDEIIVGDGRLEMQKREDDKYDLIILDAFTSDSVPVHLITKEAMQMYKQRLNENGKIAVHISNRYLDLAPIVTKTAAEAAFQAHFLRQQEDMDRLQASNQWILLSREGDDVQSLYTAGWLKVSAGNYSLRPWTDQYSNILSILRK